jgi:hypothetical protein
VCPLALCKSAHAYIYEWVFERSAHHPNKITVISYQHLGIKAVFERLDFGWHESAGEAVHHYCTQHIAQNIYKDCHMKRINVIFKQVARHKKAWMCEEYMKKLTILNRHPVST